MIRRPAFAPPGASGGGAGRAEAGGPPWLELAMERTLDAAPDEVWAAIGDFHDMGWHPAVASQTGGGGHEPEVATRVLHLKADAGDPTISETLTKHDPATRTYAYRITEVDAGVLPVTHYTSTLTVREDAGKARVEWRGGFCRGHPDDDPPAGLNDEAAIAAVAGVYQAGLDALAERFGTCE